MNFFGKKQTPAEQMREQNRQLRKAQRGVENDRKDLERQEKELENEIRKAAKQGNKEVCAILAKNLVQIRKQKARTYTASTKIQSIGSQTKAMQSNVKLADSISLATKTMGAVNSEVSAKDLMKTMQEFEKGSMKMEMTEEIMDDSLNAILDESGDEEEQDAIVTQVLDEIGIEISGKVAQAPAAHSSTLGESSKTKSKATLLSDEEIEKQLANLKM